MSNSWSDIFAALPQGEAAIRYGIAFTPRSGSTWLGDVLSRSGLLGMPREYFNPEAAGPTLTSSACTNFPDYYQYLKIVKQANGVFGFEVNWPRLNSIIGENHWPLFEDINAWFFLRREDFVAQAVSLFKAIQSGVFHSHDGKKARQPVVYDGGKIAEAVFTLMNSEYQLSQHFKEFGITPVELWYEHIVPLAPVDVVKLFAERLQITLGADDVQRLAAMTPKLKKIGDSTNTELADRFRGEHRELVDYWQEARGTETCRSFRSQRAQYRR